MMIRFLLVFCLLSSFGLDLRSQTLSEGELNRAVLLSPWVGGESPKWDSTRQGKQWTQMLPGHGQIDYGNRFGDNWDIMAISTGTAVRTRMVEIGKHDWNAVFEVPYVKPLRKLEAGEKRTISVNTSGTRAPDGKTYGTSTVENKVSAGVKRETGEDVPDDFRPFIAAKKGYMYVMRVVDAKVDEYFMIRVDDIERGDKLYLSFKRIDPPAEPIR